MVYSFFPFLANLKLFLTGNYVKKHPAPLATDNFATFNDLGDKITSQQTKLIFENDPHPSTAVKKMRDFRDKCMNVAEIEKTRTTTLRADLIVCSLVNLFNLISFKTIGKCPMIHTDWTNLDLTRTLTEMTRLTGENFLFDLEASKTPDGDKVM